MDPTPRRGSPLSRGGISASLGGALVATLLACALAVPPGTRGAEPEPFGISAFAIQPTQPSAADETVNEPYLFNQAGGHPFALTSTVRFASEEVSGANRTLVPTGDPKDMIIDLPSGLVVNPQAVPHCLQGRVGHCPTDTQVGVFVMNAGFGGGDVTLLGPIVNLTPAGGQSAELGLETPFGMFLLMGRVVRTSEGYTSEIVAGGLPALGITGIEITLWGVPAAAAHDRLRGISCLDSGGGGESSLGHSCLKEGVSDGEEPVAFLTMPSGCSESPPAVAWADSWEEPGHYVQAQSTLPAMAYCERSPFDPEIEVGAEALAPDRPVGIGVDIRVPQPGGGAIVAAPPLRGATVTLPPGVAINPAVAGGLKACEASGPEGFDMPTGLGASGAPLDPGEVGPGEELGLGGEPLLAPGHCPKESTVGKVEAETPLLAHPIEGRVYIAKPGCGGEGQSGCTEQDAVDGTLYRLYIELGSDARTGEGALIKLEAKVAANPATGQLSVRLDDMPQIPIGELSIQLYGGERALLVNPATCGEARSTAELEPWGAPLTPSGAPSSYYEVEGCKSPRPFDPGLLAGSMNVGAGEFSAFALTVTRKDSEQNLAALQVQTPPGLSAMLASVPLCPDSLASAGSCPEDSRIGSSEVAVGAGSRPLELPGSVYLTGPYGGGPFGLAIVTDATTATLDLGRLVIRARIDVDPRTAALTITSDRLPQIVLGVPLRIKSIGLTLDRPHFLVNPTNCEPQQIVARIASVEAMERDLSNRFALADCRSLDFKPTIAAWTTAGRGLSAGASLDMKVTFPKPVVGGQANLAGIRVALPRQLPTRLTSLQGSCPSAVFEENPAACPSASIVGIARARTPVLPGELVGPVYLVAHGRNVVPSPVVVLEDDGVMLELSGATSIDARGIAHVAFADTPDVPLGRLELLLPAGPHSLLGVNTSLCKGRTIVVKRRTTRKVSGRSVRRTVRVRERVAATLPLASELVGHNGAVINRIAGIAVKGCTARQLASPGGRGLR
jgi:hypothetical protein